MPGLPFLSLVLVVVAVAVEASPLEDRSLLALCKLQRRNIQLPNRFTKSRITKMDSDGGYIIVFQREKKVSSCMQRVLSSPAIFTWNPSSPPPD